MTLAIRTTLLFLSILFPPSHAVWSVKEGEKMLQKQAEQQQQAEYGVDISFPIHREKVSTNYAWLPHNVKGTPTPPEYKDMPIQPLSGRQKFYDDYLNGCVKKFGKKGQRCITMERDRIEMSLRQPQSMQNYTDIGFKKIKAPAELWNMVIDFWNKNKDRSKPEKWGVGNTYTNNWEVGSRMVSVEDASLRGGGFKLKQMIWDSAKSIITEWTGQELTQCSLYGIRIYYQGAVLATHVDRLPLVSSAIINVAQDLDEPWPLEVYGHDGKATNVTMEPGDMVLYESHSVLHGRPFPLKGRFMANIFIHFEPVGHTLRHNEKIDLMFQEESNKDVHAKYREALERGHGGHENELHDGLPPYIIPGSPEESHWRQLHPDGLPSKKKSFTTGSTPVHLAAQHGDVESLKNYIQENRDAINARDANGWTPLVESARGGHLEAVKLLVEHGADPNVKTYGNGGTALWWAKKMHGDDHPVIEFLESIGALEAGPEL